tara:strand:- start:382 stop:498 length:117 start_codon:yes stop_codon:yes gene_type:complete
MEEIRLDEEPDLKSGGHYKGVFGVRVPILPLIEGIRIG